MKVFLFYEDHPDVSKHKTLKITLPKSWKNGPTQKVLQQFVESYNAWMEKQQQQPAKNDADADTGEATVDNSNETYLLNVKDLHLALPSDDNKNSSNNDNNNDNNSSSWIQLASDETVINCIPDRANVYVKHGPPPTLASQRHSQAELQQQQQQAAANNEKKEEPSMVACTHFGCQNRFPPGGPYPTNCRYHKSPPIFHETAKYWSCCPHKKAYDWEDFQQIPGCMEGTCTDVKEDTGQKAFLGGCDVREQLSGGGSKLKSIEEFNRQAVAGGGGASTATLERLKAVLLEMDMEAELFDQVVQGIKKENAGGGGDVNDVDDAVVVTALGKNIKNAFKAMAVDQLRIK